MNFFTINNSRYLKRKEKMMVTEIIAWENDIFYWKRHDNLLSFGLPRNRNRE
jgi:hypothetical protein